jgi:phosphatidylinositol alpha 1,6-mannosyltransferase
VRIAIVAESFLPAVNGVSNTVERLARHLVRRGHQTLIIAPGPGDDHADTTPVVRMRSFGVPFYRECRVAVAGDQLDDELQAFDPDVVHLAAPFVLGRRAGRVASRIGVPVVAAFQTDLAGFARRYLLGIAEEGVWTMVREAHRDAAITLAPSTVTCWQLRERGIAPVSLWPRGVDLQRFAPGHRDDRFRRRLAPDGEVLVGYVGRLAREKEIERLVPLTRVAGIKVVIVGDGPRRRALERAMPNAAFAGFRRGRELSSIVASLDIFVHPGLSETFCQAIQEALAAGVPVVAPAAGGPLDLVRHGDNGFLWSPEAPETLVGAVRHLAADPWLRRKLASNARPSVHGRTWDVMLDKAIDHYRTVADDRLLRTA